MTRANPATYLAASTCTFTCGSGSSCCSKTFTLERGWVGRIRVYAVDSSSTPTSDFAEFLVTMSGTGPDRIDPFTSTVVPNDGRHRSFSWRVPRDNGYAIQSYILRRTDADAANITHDYIFNCTTTQASTAQPNPNPDAGTEPVACTSYTTSCYPSGFRCTGTYSAVAGTADPSWSGGYVNLTVGSDIDDNLGSYLEPKKACACAGTA
mgnify:CR=1 FL=1